MESLVDLLPLLFVGAYYLLSMRRKAEARKRAAAAPLVDDGSPPADATPFQAFLAQLEEAVAEANGAPSPLDEAPQPPEAEAPIPLAPVVERPVVALGTEFSPTIGSFDAPDPVDHDAHGFGDENPFSEEAFERAPAFRPRPRRTQDYDPHGLRQTKRAARAEGWGQRLSDPGTARDAFVLQTIFGRHGGRRRDRR